MKILLTGGAGFIASHIVDGYISRGHQVTVVDNLSTGKKEFINKKARFFKADITDKRGISEILKKVKPEIINHHAAQISVRQSVEDPLFDARVNIIGLLNLLEEGKVYGLKKVIFASSGGVVYGDARKIPTFEDYFPQLPLSPYGVAKLCSEHYLNFYFSTYGIPYISLRYGNVYGPRQNPHGEAGVVAIFSLKLLNKETPLINGDGKQTRDYVYVSDVVKANLKATESSFVGPLNIATGTQTDVNQIYQGIETVVNSGNKAEHGPPKQGEQRRSCLDIKLAGKVLSWRPKISLPEGLYKTVSYFRNEQDLRTSFRTPMTIGVRNLAKRKRF